MAVARDTARQAGEAIDAQRQVLAEAITARHFELRPALEARFGSHGRAKCLQDNLYHLSFLSEALASGLPSLFVDYVAWAKVMLAGRNVPAHDLATNLEVIGDMLGSLLPEDLAPAAVEFVETGLRGLATAPAALPTVIGEAGPLAELARQYVDALLAGQRHRASELVLGAVKTGVGVKDVYLGVFEPAQHEIGRLWQMNEISVAQEHYCTAATQLVMSQLYPYIFAGERNGRTLVATCVAENLHEIGVRMVSDFFEMEGWDTFYLGANAPAESIVRAVAERRADVLALSATLAPHVRAVIDLIAAVRSSPRCANVKVLVGGYPFNATPDLWREVGADAHARDAQGAIAVAGQLVGGASR
jgi:methanogenic corrinoid protein MtbC1